MSENQQICLESTKSMSIMSFGTVLLIWSNEPHQNDIKTNILYHVHNHKVILERSVLSNNDVEVTTLDYIW